MREKVLVFPDLETLSREAASAVVRRSKESIAARGRFLLALSGGTTPARLFALLGSVHRQEIPWSLTQIYWVDERCVPPGHKDSNYRLARETMLSRVPIPAENVHRIAGERPPEEAARLYEYDLREAFGGVPSFDLILLGVGSDGHTASLFPGSPALMEQERQAVPVFAGPDRGWRITLTFPVLNNAHEVFFLVSGGSKADALGDILHDGRLRKQYPAGLVRPSHGRVTWLIDRDAAEKLPGGISQS